MCKLNTFSVHYLYTQYINKLLNCVVYVCVLLRERTFDWLENWRHVSIYFEFDGFTFSIARTFYQLELRRHNH